MHRQRYCKKRIEQHRNFKQVSEVIGRLDILQPSCHLYGCCRSLRMDPFGAHFVDTRVQEAGADKKGQYDEREGCGPKNVPGPEAEAATVSRGHGSLVESLT